MQEQMKIREATSYVKSMSPAALSCRMPAAQQQEREQEGAAVFLSHYLWILRRQCWKVVAFVAVCVFATVIVSARLAPIYESTATVDIEHQAPPQVVGQQTTQSAQMDPEEFLATQIKLIQSDSVLRPVAEQFHLLNLGGRSGQESQMVQRMAAAPVTLSGLRVTRPTGTYLLQISYRAADPSRAADVANAVARSYLTYTYDLRIQASTDLSFFMEKQVDELKAKMEQSNLALAQFERDLDVINPDEKTNILSARLLQLNADYTVAQAERIRSEAAWNATKSGSSDAAQAFLQGDPLSTLNDALNKARQQFALVKATYGSSHPEYHKAASELAEVQKEYDKAKRGLADRIEVNFKESQDREQMLQAAVAETKAEWDSMSAKSFQYQRLKQDADTDKALYDELVKKIREGDINAGFQNNNIRLADFARPPLTPVYPNKRRNLQLAFGLSALLAIGAAILLDSLDRTLRDPKEASRFLGADVIATMPADRDAAQLPYAADPPVVPALVPTASENGRRRTNYQSGSRFDEAIRTLRNTILLSDFEDRLHSIVFTSAVPSEGKSTLAAHLAIANADRGKKTLLVDGDLRRPSLHSKFGLTPRKGLSNVLNGDLPWQEAVIPIEGTPNLSLLPAGLGSHRAADLIGPRLATLLDEFAKEYDLAFLDSPPLLGFAECLQMAAAADGVLIASLAGKTKRGAVAEVIGALRRVRANIVGVVLNQVSRNTSADGYSYYGYYSYNNYRYRDTQQTQSEIH